MTSQLIRESAAAGILAGVVALSGCGAAHEVASTAPPTRSPAPAATPETRAAVPAALRGSWTRTMKPRDWRSAGSGYPLRTWRLGVDGRGQASVYLPRTDAVDFTTQLLVKAHDLTVESIPVCPGQTGRYTWHGSSGALK